MQPTNPGSGSKTALYAFAVFTAFVFLILVMAIAIQAASGDENVEVATAQPSAQDEFFPPIRVPVAGESSPVELQMVLDVDCDDPEVVFLGNNRSLTPAATLREFVNQFEDSDHRLQSFEERNDVFAYGYYVDEAGNRSRTARGQLSAAGWVPTGVASCPPVRPLPVVTTTVAPLTTTAAPTTTDVSTTSTTTSTPTTTTTTVPLVNGRPVPDVVGLDVNDAIIELFDWNLQFTRDDEASDTIPVGVVIRSEPEAGTQVESNSVIVIVVSSGEG